MSKRVDTASKLIHAPASRIYAAFATESAMETWLPNRLIKIVNRTFGKYFIQMISI